MKTRIICTLGPASDDETTLRKMMLAGMDVARLNFSHGTHQFHGALIGLVRGLNKKYRRHIRILQDLEGFRIRVGALKGHKPLELKKRSTLWLIQGDMEGFGDTVSFDYGGHISDIGPGRIIYIDDGNIALLVKSRRAGRLKTEVITGGILKEHKGINIPGARLHFSGLTGKDRDDIRFGIENKVDFIAQSFVRSKYDIIKIRNIIKGALPQVRLIAKIENREGIRNIDSIIENSDGIMIARGDMGVSVPLYEIPVIQKEIIKKCNLKRKFVITATQMLESMTENPRPTRAEVTDVANAIVDGSDYVMLSAETAAGAHPVEAVRMMNQIIKFTEGSGFYKIKNAALGLAVGALLSLALTSCAAVPKAPEIAPVKNIYQQIHPPVARKDITHVVAPGETLWRLGKMYDVSVEEIMRANNIMGRDRLSMGKRLIIPRAMPIKAIVPLYASKKWRYIIIHHSATDTGNALSLFKLHLRRGFWHGLGYQFVISNGTSGKADGQIEVSPRWTHQDVGAHCKADNMNYCGIGICLVGNFSKERVSEKQLDSLAYLVNILRGYYNIPVKNILGHGQVRGAATECPGNNFPWKEFYERLK